MRISDWSSDVCSSDLDAVADAIARTTIEEVAMPRVDRYEGGEVAPGKAGIGRNAGVDDRIVAVTPAIEIILGITGGIVVHVDETGARLAMIVMMDHRIMSNAQLPFRGRSEERRVGQE